LLNVNRPDEARRELAALTAGARATRTVGVEMMIDLDERRFDALQRTLGDAPPGRRQQAAGFWAFYVIALGPAGRLDDAYREAGQLTSAFPDDCQGKALWAGLSLEKRQPAAAHAIAARLIASALAPNVEPSQIRCAATAAAATRDGPALARILDRVAASESLLRLWALDVSGITGRTLLRGRLCPWTSIVDDPAVAPARQRLDEAYARERRIAEEKLAGLLDR